MPSQDTKAGSIWKKGMQSMLARKGDEHAFSLLYLAAGIFCLYAAHAHGDSFCTNTPEGGDAPWGDLASTFLSSTSGIPQKHQHLAGMSAAALKDLKSRSLSQHSSETSEEHGGSHRRRLLGMGTISHQKAYGRKADFLFLAERPTPRSGGVVKTLLFGADRNATLVVEVRQSGRQDSASGSPSVFFTAMGQRGKKNPDVYVKASVTATNTAGDGVHDLLAEKSDEATEASLDADSAGWWAGRHGMVVFWLHVEGFTALFLPGLSMVILCMGLQDSPLISATLYIVAVFQAICLAVGCVWSFGGFVPETCRQGHTGDPFAFNAMWWVCTVWLGAIVSISTVLCCILSCFVGAFVPTISNKETYRHVSSEDDNLPA